MKAFLITTALITIASAPFNGIARDESTPRREAATRSGNVASIVATQPDLSVFATLIDVSGMRQELTGGGPYTILAPTDEAFQMLGEGALEHLMAPENRGELLSLVRYHIIPGKMEASTIRSGEVKTLQGSKVAINADSSAIWIGRAEIMRPDIRAANGVIHAINMVMEPDEQ